MRSRTDVTSTLHFIATKTLMRRGTHPRQHTSSQLRYKLSTGPTLPSTNNIPLSQISVRTRARPVTCSRGDFPWFYHAINKPPLPLHRPFCLVIRLQSLGHSTSALQSTELFSYQTPKSGPQYIRNAEHLTLWLQDYKVRATVRQHCRALNSLVTRLHTAGHSTST